MHTREIATSWVGELDAKSGLTFDPPRATLPIESKHWVVYNGGNRPVKIIVTMITEEIAE